MSEWNSLDFKPRARGLVIGDLPWLGDRARWPAEFCSPGQCLAEDWLCGE